MTAPLLITPDSITLLRPLRDAATRRAVESLSHNLESEHPELAMELCAALSEEQPQEPKASISFDGKAFGRKVRERRREAGLSIRRLAQSLSLSPSTILRIERGSVAEIDTMLALSLWTGCELNSFAKDSSPHETSLS